MKKISRQAKSIARIRAERRAEQRCADCGRPSAKFRCDRCRPKKTAAQISAAGRAAALARWKK